MKNGSFSKIVYVSEPYRDPRPPKFKPNNFTLHDKSFSVSHKPKLIGDKFKLKPLHSTEPYVDYVTMMRTKSKKGKVKLLHRNRFVAGISSDKIILERFRSSNPKWVPAFDKNEAHQKEIKKVAARRSAERHKKDKKYNMYEGWKVRHGYRWIPRHGYDRNGKPCTVDPIEEFRKREIEEHRKKIEHISRGIRFSSVCRKKSRPLDASKQGFPLIYSRDEKCIPCKPVQDFRTHEEKLYQKKLSPLEIVQRKRQIMLKKRGKNRAQFPFKVTASKGELIGEKPEYVPCDGIDKAQQLTLIQPDRLLPERKWKGNLPESLQMRPSFQLTGPSGTKETRSVHEGTILLRRVVNKTRKIVNNDDKLQKKKNLEVSQLDPQKAE